MTVFHMTINIPKTDVAVAMEPPKALEVTQPQNPKVELRNKPREEKSSISPSKKAEFRQSGSGDSPIPKRAKFIKKFGAPKAVSKDKKKSIKMSSTKLTAEGGRVKKSEKKSKRSVSGTPDSAEQKVPPAKLRKESITKESGGKRRKVSKTNIKSAPEPKQEIPKKKVSLHLEPAASGGPKLQAQVSSSSQTPPTSSYEVVAETLADALVKETISTQSKS